MQTVMASKLAEKGFIAREVKFNVALSEFQNNGGSFERAMSLVMTAYGKGSGGSANTSYLGFNGKGEVISLTHDDGKGLVKTAQKATHSVPAPSSPERNRAGQTGIAEKARSRLPSPVSPVYLTAAKQGAKAIALTVLDSFKVRDGRAIGDVPFSSLDRLISEGGREVSVLKMVRSRGRPTNLNSPIRLLVGTQEMERFIQKAAEMSDAA